MKIQEIDKNFQSHATLVGEKAVYTLPSPAFALFGVEYDTNYGFVRMDMDVAKSLNENLAGLSRMTAGGRACFETDSSSLSIAVTYDQLIKMSHMPLTGSSSFSLFEVTEKGERHLVNLMPIAADEYGFTAAFNFSGKKMRKLVMYFPLYNEVKTLSISLDKDASVQPYNPYRAIAPILYYGSSITQGGCASRPDNSYQALICKRNRIDYINLGFSGNAKGEKEMVAYLGGLDCSLFVCDYDHNAPTAAYLQATHYPLYKQFREMQPNTPILFLSRPDIARGNNEGEERLKIVRSTYLKAKRAGDDNVYFLSGKNFYGKDDCWDYAVDSTHPTDYGFAVMAKKIYKKICQIDEKFV